jgi:predicted nucleic acid-binding protein
VTLVVDASVAAKWVLPEPGSEAAAELRTLEPDLVAPSIIVAEIGNAIWKSAMRGDLGKSDASEALQIALAHFSKLFPIHDLASVAAAIAIDLRHPIYDCFYLALAERERAPLISADKRLLAAARLMKGIEVREL